MRSLKASALGRRGYSRETLSRQMKLVLRSSDLAGLLVKADELRHDSCSFSGVSRATSDASSSGYKSDNFLARGSV